jgi:hypothetical protein
MYLRFVTMSIHPLSRVSLGIFQAAYKLHYGDALSDYEREQLRAILDWFNEYLPAPTRFTRSRRKTYLRHGVCWFKPSARTCLAHIWEMAALLENNGVWVRMLKAERPGLVLYEDAWQIVAQPSLPKRR